jgi:hypothetical protein
MSYMFEAPAVGPDGTIYVGASSLDLQGRRIVAVTPDGRERWSYGIERWFATGHLAVDADGTVYSGGDEGASWTIALSREGELIWEFHDEYRLESPTAPVLGHDGTIYIGSYSGYLFALNLDGSERWAYRNKDGLGVIYTPALGADGSIYFDGYDLTALHPDGSLQWLYEVEYGPYCAPAVGPDGTVYAVGASSLHAVNTDGTRRWLYTMEREFAQGGPAVGHDGTVYLPCERGTLRAIDPDGSPQWMFTVEGIIRASPIATADGDIYIITDDKLYALNAGGSLRWWLDFSGTWASQPAVGQDRVLYVGADRLYAINADGSLRWTFEATCDSPATGLSPSGGELSSS